VRGCNGVKKRVLLINAIRTHAEEERRQPHLGLGYLVSALRGRFGEDLFDFRITDRQIERHARKFKPDVVFITSVTQNFNIAMEYGRLVRNDGVPVILGGIHISLMPSSLNECFDAGVVGEGEETIVELVELFLRKGKFLPQDLMGISGVVFMDGGSLKVTPPRPQIEDLDSIASPARDLLRVYSHASMFTSRGCHYACAFCASARLWEGVRYFSPEYVIREIMGLVENYGVRLISFYDNLFTSNIGRLERLACLIKKEKRLKGVRFTCNARAELISDVVAQQLKEMRIASVNLGLESGSDATLAYLKRGASVEQNLNAIETIKRHGIAVQGSFVIGSPLETQEDILKTCEFIKNASLSLVDIYRLTPYPGTPLWEYAESRNIVSQHMDWNMLDANLLPENREPVMLSEVLTRGQLWRLSRKLSMVRFMKNLKGIFSHPYLADMPRIAKLLLYQRIHRMMAEQRWA